LHQSLERTIIMTMVTNPPATIDDAAFAVRRTVAIAAPVDKVWAAITEPQHLVRWFGQRADLPELAVGARGSLGFDGYGDFPLRIEELDSPHTIAYRWSNDNATPPADPGAGDAEVFARSTVFRFTLEPNPEGTLLTVVETGFDSLGDPAAAMASNRRGWTDEIDELVAYLEAR
jgi:uncharacterized protein YndB with AHSA1/START domain